MFDTEVRRTKRAYHRHLQDKLLSNYRARPKDSGGRYINLVFIKSGRKKVYLIKLKTVMVK